MLILLHGDKHKRGRTFLDKLHIVVKTLCSNATINSSKGSGFTLIKRTTSIVSSPSGHLLARRKCLITRQMIPYDQAKLSTNVSPPDLNFDYSRLLYGYITIYL